ncbi:DUF3768 domain-containing protein [Roseovarius sp. M141]|uniref:DUF3768 domain-containing protein n=1 Tax=Roseovarius sp. M141 TaxID=2583806 RepID=UPI0020CBFD7E|nr:DUF3768 domain-containing protein [Roseovarius sp. M141]
MNLDALEMTEAEHQARRIAEQNDQFRKHVLTGGPAGTPQGRIVMTRAVAEVGPTFQMEVTRAVMADETFTEDNDPYGDHTFGAVTVQGRKVWWKIDLYDLDYRWGSETPDDPSQTRRVLTVMFPSDY